MNQHDDTRVRLDWMLVQVIIGLSPPTKDNLKKFKSDHEWSSLLEGLPCALELVHTLNIWRNHRGTAPREIVESLERVEMNFDLVHKRLADEEHRAACLNLLEELNSVVNRVISDGTLGGGDAGSRSALIPARLPQQQDPYRSHGFPAVLNEATFQLSSSAVPPRETPPSETPQPRPSLPPEPAIKFSRAVTPGENATFIALFKAVHATPRKIKRVVNM